jgi:hypothetical protein
LKTLSFNKHYSETAADRKHDYSSQKQASHLAQSIVLFWRVIAGWDGSHSTDQPGGKVQGHGELTTESLNDIPENHIISKAEYTNTQQGLPVNWVYLAHN